MAADRVAALRRERDDVLAFCRLLADDEWKVPSGCLGWSVQDVVAHMTATVHGVFTPWLIKLIRSKDLERNNDADVEARRDRSPAEVLAEYETWSGRLPALLQAGQLPGLKMVPFPIAEIGRYPLALIASAFLFDHHTHLRHDLAPALGRPSPPTDEGRMAVVIEWMLAGLPQMCRESLSFIDRPVLLTLEGPGGGTWAVVPRPGGGRVEVRTGPTVGAVAHVTGVAEEFPVWGTTRRPWREHDLKLEGDEAYAARFLDAVKIV
ncbi:MAG: maleylpyruvate isomerase family mycothiol-dependent enzyme [Actinomycetota bacterium]|nr:maleylpyruvate isomerase family mycothiol-dependent enzyme [Actinomycetota bacterium]